MSSQQARLTAFQPVPDGEVTAAAWDPTAPARDCSRCGARLDARWRDVMGIDRCKDCYEPQGVDR